jgi:hypothetical protein
MRETAESWGEETCFVVAIRAYETAITQEFGARIFDVTNTKWLEGAVSGIVINNISVRAEMRHGKFVIFCDRHDVECNSFINSFINGDREAEKVRKAKRTAALGTFLGLFSEWRALSTHIAYLESDVRAFKLLKARIGRCFGAGVFRFLQLPLLQNAEVFVELRGVWIRIKHWLNRDEGFGIEEITDRGGQPPKIQLTEWATAKGIVHPYAEED